MNQAINLASWLFVYEAIRAIFEKTIPGEKNDFPGARYQRMACNIFPILATAGLGYHWQAMYSPSSKPEREK